MSTDPLEEGRVASKRKEFQTALKIWMPLAEQGNAAAMVEIAGLYCKGWGVKWDKNEAKKWYLNASALGNRESKYWLGWLHLNGKDDGPGIPKNCGEALKWYRAAADEGDAYAQCAIGDLYESGECVPQDYAEAMKWFRKAADQGARFGMYSVGWMYYAGWGVKQDYSEARKWIQQSANTGWHPAQHRLGDMYWRGEEVTQDYILAYMWFLLAADFDPKAPWFEEIGKEMTQEQMQESSRLARSWKAQDDRWESLM